MKIKTFLLGGIVALTACALLACSEQTKANGKSDDSAETAEQTTTEELIVQAEIQTETVTEPELPPEPPPTNFEITLSFAGDCTFANVNNSNQNSGFLSYFNKNEPSYFLEKVKPIFEADDFTIVNLECVLSDQNLGRRGKGTGTAFWFKGPTKHTEILTEGSVEGVSLANNHTYDYGNTGCQDTKDAVTNAGLQYGFESEIMYFEKNGFVIAVICHGLWYESQADTIIKLIETADEQSDYQIVFYHGGTEGSHAPEAWRVRASQKMVDNGADLVIGNHPHVLQPIETYNGVQIVYSLGNFCFGGNSRPKNRTMIYQTVLTVNFESLQIEESRYEAIPCYVYTAKTNNYQPAPIENEDERERVIKFLNKELRLPY